MRPPRPRRETFSVKLSDVALAFFYSVSDKDIHIFDKHSRKLASMDGRTNASIAIVFTATRRRREGVPDHRL
jgi:hypothetical protein